MARFYGWTDDYIDSMPANKFDDYYLSIGALSSEELLNYIQVSTYPHMTKPARDRIFNKLRKIGSSLIRRDTEVSERPMLEKIFGKKNG